MFEKIFTYSSIDKKENRVSGVLDAVKLVLLLFPAAGLCMGMVSCFVIYMTDIVYKRIYYAVSAMLIAVIVAALIRWVMEMFMVYAISNDGKLYRFKMFDFAMGYLGIGSKVGEVATKGMGRFLSTFELMMKIKKTIENLDNEQQITEMFSKGYVDELSDLKVVRRNEYGIRVLALCKGDDKKKRIKLRIRKVYSDWENLFNYIEYISENKDGSIKDFHFTKKTTYEDFIVKKPSYMKRIIRQSVWVLIVAAWLSVFTLSGDINKQSKINEGLYKKADAKIVSVNDKGKKAQEVIIGYQVEGMEYNETIRSGKGEYQAGEKIDLYYESGNPKKSVMFAFDEHINYKPILVIVLFCEVVILTVNINVKGKSEN